jgi:hypothetical protein
MSVRDFVFGQMSPPHLALACFAVCGAARLECQVVRGRTVLPDSVTPAAGILVTATDGRGVTVAHALSAATGTYVLRLPAPGRYEIKALRIGYVPATTALTVSSVDEHTVDIVLSSRPITLPTVTVTVNEDCGLRGRDADTFVRLWEQARAALAGAGSTEQAEDLDVRTLRIEGTEDKDGSRAEIDSIHAREIIGSHVFATTPPETLSVAGYVRPRPDGSVIFDAPSADALLSDEFVAKHCFRIAGAPKGHPDWIGLEFVPTDTMASVADIRGTVWLRRETAELRRLDFGYTNLKYFMDRLCDKSSGKCASIGTGDGAGGSLDFSRLETGEWLVTKWAIRTPAEAASFRADPVKMRQEGRRLDPCFDRSPDCRPLIRPVARYSTTFGSVSDVMRRGTEVYRDTSSLAAVSRIAARRAGRSPAHVTGVVTDVDGHFLARVVVRTDDPARAAVSNDSGHFEIRMLPAKEVRVSVQKPGFEPVVFRLPLIADSTRHVRLSLVPTAAPKSP